MDKLLSVFTEKYSTIQNKIINSVVIMNSRTNNAIPARAQWDTGATGTCISKELANRLNLIPLGIQQIHTPSGIGAVKRYKADMVLNNELIIQNIDVIDSEIGSQGIDILIGMNIIQLGDFAISNYNGQTQFSFRIPSYEHVDYKDMLNEVATTKE